MAFLKEFLAYIFQFDCFEGSGQSCEHHTKYNQEYEKALLTQFLWLKYEHRFYLHIYTGFIFIFTDTVVFFFVVAGFICPLGCCICLHSFQI